MPFNILPFFAAGATAASGLLARSRSQRLWRALDTPTVPTGHPLLGTIEVKGTVGLPAPLQPWISPLTAESCAYISFEIQKETGGKNKSWKTIDTVRPNEWITFDDGSGPIVVHLKGASLESLEETVHAKSSLPATFTANGLRSSLLGSSSVPTEKPAEPSLLKRLVSEVGYGPDKPISTMSGKWRVREQFLPVGSVGYAYGSTVYNDAARQAILAVQESRPLIVFGGTEDEFIRNSRKAMYLGALGMLLGAFFTVAFFTGKIYSLPNGKDKIEPNWRLGLLGPWFVFLAIVVAQVFRIYNRVVATNEQIDASHRLVDIAEQKRATLVPQLAEVVKAAATHEQTLHTLAAQLRHEAIHAADFVALGERYPALQTNTNYLSLQKTLVHLEDEIATARSYVLDAETIHKNRIRTFPDSWIAPLTATKRTFTTDQSVGAPPQ